ncbi:hypothetical protein AgCh_022128 [Apium graveolens]
MFVLEKVPYVIKDVVYLLFTESFSEPLDEVSFLINEELIAEDRERERENVEESPKTPKAPVSKAKPKAGLGNKVDKKELDTLKKPDTIDEPKTGESVKVKAKKNMNALVPAMPNMPSFREPCGVVGCMSCAFATMSEYFKAFHATASTCTDTKTSMSNEHTQAKTVVPPVSMSGNSIKTSTENESFNMKAKPVKGRVRKENIMWILDRGCSRHMTGEKSLLTGLKHNLLSVSQFCDKGYNTDFRPERCLITHRKDEKLALQGVRKGNLFVADLKSTCDGVMRCFYKKASSEQSWLWQKKLSHLNFKIMNSLVKRELVRGLPQMKFCQEGLYEACEKGKSKKACDGLNPGVRS